MVDRAIPHGARITAPEATALAAEVSGKLWRRRIGRGLLGLLVLGLLALVVIPIAGPAIRDATTTYQKPVVTTVAPGQLITLANGSTVLLSDPAWQSQTVSNAARQVLSAEVRYCGGGKTVDKNTAEDARNYVTPDRFEVTGISQANQSINDVGSQQPPLEATELQQGQCTSGEIAFWVSAAARSRARRSGITTAAGTT